MAKDLAGKNYVITGANTGIGRTTAIALAERGAHVILACRSLDKTQPVLDEIKQLGGDAEFVELDLSSFESIHKAADELLAKNIPFHALINNAGLAGKRGTTKDGFELTFGTNHLGHYLLTRLLLDRLKTSGHARIVNVSSQSHYDAKGIDFDKLRTPTKSVTGLQEYAVSKLANVLFTKELARKLEGSDVTTYAVHPGVVATDAWRQVPAPFRWLIKRFMISPQQGAHSSLRAATAPELANETGRYYHADGKEKRPAKLADDVQLAQTLWQRSAEWTGLPA
ncbi:MAG TPA: SDR family oxidoreductase [Kofleriaceae bacterium]|jgi:NAD(P)-dependent dehydrogenase (short-subunit alcohol dehydrogenase family)